MAYSLEVDVVMVSIKWMNISFPKSSVVFVLCIRTSIRVLVTQRL
jgi:hypothetical protein